MAVSTIASDAKLRRTAEPSLEMHLQMIDTFKPGACLKIVIHQQHTAAIGLLRAALQSYQNKVCRKVKLLWRHSRRPAESTVKEESANTHRPV